MRLRVLAHLLLIEEHLVNDAPLRHLLNVDIEDVFTALAVDTAYFVLQKLNAVKSLGN